MKNLFNTSVSRNSKFYSPLVELEVPNHNQRKVPRHISVRETNSHRRRGTFSQIDCIPRMCHLKPAPESNIAVDILRYQLSDRPTQQKHLANVRCNLRHRLSVAQANGNTELVLSLIHI